jgi:hypothetical protein
LKTWDVFKDGYIQLHLRDVHSSADHHFIRRSSPSFDWETDGVPRTSSALDATNRILDLWSWRFRYSYIHLYRPEDLPSGPVVRFFAKTPSTRTVCDRVVVDIASRLPNLRKAHWRMNCPDNRFIAFRRTHRHDLAQAITEALPQAAGLQSLIMEAVFHDFSPHFSVGTLHPGIATDPLSNAIRTVTGSMKELKILRIKGEIDSLLFWPGPAPAILQPYWQSLEHLTVRFSTRRPS